ncbi:MAG TPA: hypothetical protein PLP29_01375 [Candidatus Ozemobacteraceae bacterium]|nr:hypothetical protein [Candidatus Ozemobacteraceae bacterium]
MNSSIPRFAEATTRRASILYIIIYYFILLCPAVSTACSPSDFILDEFSLRCKDLAEQVRDTELAYRMGFPDSASRSARLLDGWLSFFLDHGIAPPPVYQTLSGHGWEEGMRSLGRLIGSIGRGETVSGEALEMSTLPLDLLGAPQKLLSCRQALASLSQRIDTLAEQPGSFPVQLATDDPLVIDAMLALTRCFEESPFLRKRLETLHFSMTSIAPATGSPLSPEDLGALAELQLGLLQEELRILGPIGFWQPAASQAPAR